MLGIGERMIHMKARWFALAAFFVWTFLTSIQVAQGDLASQQEALEVINQFARNLCNSVEPRGRGENVELSGKAKAELSGVIKKIADLGIEGAAKYQTEAYELDNQVFCS
jgi:hypothetical protein